MFEHFTEKALKVMMLAQEESKRLGHDFIGTEHIQRLGQQCVHTKTLIAIETKY